MEAMLEDTPGTVHWIIAYNSCVLIISSFCDSSHIVTKRSILFRVSTKATASFPASRVSRQGEIINCQCLRVAGKLGQTGFNSGMLT